MAFLFKNSFYFFTSTFIDASIRNLMAYELVVEEKRERSDSRTSQTVRPKECQTGSGKYIGILSPFDIFFSIFFFHHILRPQPQVFLR